MVTLIHGEDIILSRNRFLSSKTEADIILEGKNLSLAKLLETFEGGLFGSSKNVFIENLLSLKKNIADFDKITELINKFSKNSNILIWEGSELSASNLYIFKGAAIEVFKLPQTLFSFLDNLRPRNKSNVVYFHEALKNSNSEMIFYMLLRQFRLLISLSDTSSIQIDETKKLQPWQKQKFERQLSSFSKIELQTAYNNLFKIDLGIKTGEITNLTPAIDFFLLEL